MSDLVKKIFPLTGVVHEMFLVEWTKKIELVTEQALKYLKQCTLLFEAFTMTDCSELLFCYGKMNFMKVFQKIILLFYKSELFNAAAFALHIIYIKSVSPYFLSFYLEKH
jgi:hypothetical protein